MKPTPDLNTEARIKQAAQRLFTEKGFAATRTRDIADAAEINLALLNYYFRSKEKLFEIIMQENVRQFFSVIASVLNDSSISFEEKIEKLVEEYISMFNTNPDLPFFILNEVRNRPENFANQIGLKTVLLQSEFFKQLSEKTNDKIDPLHFLLNLFSLTIYPYVAGPLFRIVNDLSKSEYDKFNEERKRLIPIWMSNMLNVKTN